MGDAPSNSVEARDAGLISGSFDWIKKTLGIADKPVDKEKAAEVKTTQQMREEIEKVIGHKVTIYPSGKAESEAAPAKTEVVNGKQAVIASVDGDGYEMTWRSDEFYRTMSRAASEAIAVAGLFDKDTLAWYSEVLDGLSVLDDLKDLTDEDFKKNKHKKLLYNFVKTHKDSLLYGPKGAFQFSLAFQRARNGCPQLNDADKIEAVDAKGQRDLSSLNIASIKLIHGEGRGEKDGQKDRYSISAWEKEAKAAGGGAAGGGLTQEPPKAPDVPAGPDASKLEFESTEFFTFYHIDNPADQQKFKDLMAEFKPHLEGKATPKNNDEMDAILVKLNGFKESFGDYFYAENEPRNHAIRALHFEYFGQRIKNSKQEETTVLNTSYREIVDVGKFVVDKMSGEDKKDALSMILTGIDYLIPKATGDELKEYQDLRIKYQGELDKMPK